MSIAKPFTFVANTFAKASEVNANFDTVYSQVNSNISAISQNTVDIENLENNKADINGNTAQRFAVADAITDGDAINKRSLKAAIGNSIDYISGFTITRDSGSPNNTIIVSEGSCYDSTKTVVLNKTNSSTKTNDNQAASATYYIYVIGNTTGSSIDILISESGVTPALPVGYTRYRMIGNYTTDSENKISTINYYGHNSSAPQGAEAIAKYGCVTNHSYCTKGYRIGASGTTYVMAFDGWLQFLAQAPDEGMTQRSPWISLRNVTSGNLLTSGSVYNLSQSLFLPVQKGDTVEIGYGNRAIDGFGYLTLWSFVGNEDEADSRS